MRDVKYGTFAPLADWRMAREAALTAEAAGYDFVSHGDTVNLWIPRELWTEDLTPYANLIDVDQAMDCWLMMADIATRTERIFQGTTVCDALRRNPSNYAQLLLTLDNMSSGRCFLGMGSGEYRHFGAYGIARDRPFAHLEEAVQIIKLLRDSVEPVSFEGNIWNLDRAVMSARPFHPASPPPVLVAGSGPRALRIAGEYADGWIALTPIGGNAEEVAEAIRTVKEHAERVGRDPESLRFLATSLCLIGTDEEEVEQMTHHPLIRWDCASLMLNGGDWKTVVGVDHPIRPDYSYARDLTSMWFPADDARKVIEQTPPAIVRHCRHAGTPTQVAQQLQPLIEAGITWMAPVNFAMFVGDPGAAAGRDLVGEVCAELRTLNGQPAVDTLITVGGTS
jgi:alkanesulfonate monooxygenase SsuD/methylene tetrahydromethanopterin reductase-like flavin-dependent oxidoreductase (luciferase family)